MENLTAFSCYSFWHREGMMQQNLSSLQDWFFLVPFVLSNFVPFFVFAMRHDVVEALSLE